MSNPYLAQCVINLHGSMFLRLQAQVEEVQNRLHLVKKGNLKWVWICACRGSLSQEQATQLYTGGHWKVEAAVLSEVEHFSRFAVRQALPAALLRCLQLLLPRSLADVIYDVSEA